MSVRARYRKMQELYVIGVEQEFDDGTVMWLQVMNPWELEEARRDASLARSRFVLAMREVGSEEYLRLRGTFADRGNEGIINDILEAHHGNHFLTATQSLEVDKDWSEKFTILARSEELEGRPEDDPERLLLDKINLEWLEEVMKRTVDEQDFMREELESLSDDALFRKYEEEWLERRGGAVALSEYSVTELYYACRACDGVKTEDGWNHDVCDHTLRVYETKSEVRTLPDTLYIILRDAMEKVVLTAREAKNSDRLLSSSASSQQPSSPEESTVSTQTETLETVPGLL